MKLLLQSVVGLLVLSQSQPVPRDRTTFGALVGINKAPCQFWSSSRNSDQRISPQLETWLTGFVAGVGHKDKNFATIYPEDVAALLDRYCADNPSQTLPQAAGAVMDRLPKR